MGIFGRNKPVEVKPAAAPSSSGCITCEVKAAGTFCTSHLKNPIEQVASVFVKKQKMFDAKDPRQITAVAAILANDIREKVNGREVHIPYEIPTEPNLQKWFYSTLTLNVRVGLRT